MTHAKRLEEEIKFLKETIREKSEQGLKLWERDFFLCNKIENFLLEKDFSARKVETFLHDISQKLTVIDDDFPKLQVNQKELDELQNANKKLEAENKLVEMKHTMLQNDYQKKTREIDQLTENIKNLEVKLNESKMKYIKMEKANEDEKNELLYKLDKATREKEFRKYQLNQAEQENLRNVSNETPSKEMTDLLNKNAKLEGRIYILEKEKKNLMREVDYYRKCANI